MTAPLHPEMTRPDAASALDEAPDLSIVVPCLNEAEGLDAFLARMVAAAEATALSFEIVLIDDGSTDNTADPRAGRTSLRQSVVLTLQCRK